MWPATVEIRVKNFGFEIFDLLSKTESVKFHWLKSWEVSHWESVKMLSLMGSMKATERISCTDYWLSQWN